MTTKADVLKILETQKRHSDLNVSHPDEMLKEWLQAIERVLTQFKEWLQTAEEQQLVKVEPIRVAMNERIFHQYEAPGMIVTLPKGDIEIRPAGRFIVGGKGRIDIFRNPKRKLLIRTESGDWEFVEPNPVGGWTHQSLDESSFWEAIGQLAV